MAVDHIDMDNELTQVANVDMGPNLATDTGGDLLDRTPTNAHLLSLPVACTTELKYVPHEFEYLSVTYTSAQIRHLCEGIHLL